MAGVRNGDGRRGGFASAAALVVLGLTLTACSGTTPQTTSAAESPSVTATATGAVDPVPSDPAPIPTVTADPLTPTKPTPSASATTSAAPTTPAPTPTDPGSVAGACERTLPAYPVLERGAKGPAVRALQCFLNDADYGPVVVDGVYGAQTRAAVKKVEASLEGPAPKPGRIDAGMWVLLISRSLGDGTLEVGSKGADVVTLQRALRAAGGTLTVDGDFGSETKKVVRRFQQANRVGDDGVVGDETLFLLKMGATIG
ncbi:peptidoglycan-binding protein [Terrabacter sp. Soil810]|uniref:peptidoglycan-binding domain-containing protein n=1 Tax=Terrabacter sp. Soil810 TaxID=1736418 RepID=UPI0009E8499F|nr:peptidoglycan-binding protein [Terrabacter sp. Soil810]